MPDEVTIGDYVGDYYNYGGMIRGPKSLGMGEEGEDIDTNIKGLYSYVTLLTEGEGSQASTTKRPLGNKQFLKTFMKCTNIDDKSEQPRSLYINNVPTGILPGGVDIGMQGLIPGIIENIGGLVPGGMVAELLGSGKVPCKEVTLETVRSINDGMEDKKDGQGFVAITELRKLFDNKQHVKTDGTYGFEESELKEWEKTAQDMEDNPEDSQDTFTSNGLSHSIYPKQKGYRQGDMIDQLLYLGEEYDKLHEYDDDILKKIEHMFDITKANGLMNVYLIGFICLITYISMKMTYR